MQRRRWESRRGSRLTPPAVRRARRRGDFAVRASISSTAHAASRRRPSARGTLRADRADARIQARAA